jgi:hypothetical protein
LEENGVGGASDHITVRKPFSAMTLKEYPSCHQGVSKAKALPSAPETERRRDADPKARTEGHHMCICAQCKLGECDEIKGIHKS